ncbi:GtrA family protein [Stutzerimonas nitrititolerans]|uniref:GtrA family protein n=1 Tax=Stutzerimonas nitrititolerans TaxID=2482751 RepID=UPI0028AB9D47|nr:GtrA family protein [Stutzerimonas nitrititolerans]
MQKRSLAGRLLRFGMTGVLVTLVHALIVVVCVENGLVGPAPANGAAFAGATLLSYLINTRWSFARPLHGQTLVRFVLVSLVGLCLAVLIASVAEQAALDYLLGIAAVAMVVPAMTFCMHNFWTYRDS